jgi:hypothetical protein
MPSTCDRLLFVFDIDRFNWTDYCLHFPFPKGNPAGPQPFAVEGEQLRRDQQKKNHLLECSKMGTLHCFAESEK